MTKKIRLLHFGAKALNFQHLSDAFTYQWFPETYDFTAEQPAQALFEGQQLVPAYQRSIFILEQNCAFFQQELTYLAQLPAHQILYPKELHCAQEYQRVLMLKGALAVDLTAVDEVADWLAQHFLVKQQGYKLDNNYVQIHPQYRQQVQRKGNVHWQVTGPFPDQPIQVLNWKMTTLVSAKERWVFYPEFASLTGNLEVSFKLFFIREHTQQIDQVREVSWREVQAGEEIFIENQAHPCYLHVALYVCGAQGSVQLGAVHLRKALSAGHTMIPGGQRLVDPENLHGDLFYYFNAGDLKPPLAVYFSGYRSAEGFEGRRMMASMGCPYLLIADPRLEGGNFYLGSAQLESRLVGLILEKLALLGFQRSDLILSGLSMGTYGALYYAADLLPHSIIVGKPLVNLGDIALNERVHRPEGFPTSLDILYQNTQASSQQAARLLNQRFWQKFQKGNYTQTTFAIAYMKQDDYDVHAFPMLFDELKTHHPEAKLLSKGLIGRHNDNSPAINSWFLKQYRNVMVHSFQRQPSYFK